MSDIDLWKWCGQCLFGNTPQTLLIAGYEGEDGYYNDACPNPVNPIFVKKWAGAKMFAGGGKTSFSINNWSDALIPFTTLNGDAICVAHMHIHYNAPML